MRSLPEGDPTGDNSLRLLKRLGAQLGQAKELLAKAAQSLKAESPARAAETVRNDANAPLLTPRAFELSLQDCVAHGNELDAAIEHFERVAGSRSVMFVELNATTASEVRRLLDALAGFSRVKGARLSEIAACCDDLQAQRRRLTTALAKLSSIARSRGVPFDASPRSVSQLASPEGLADLLPGANTIAGVVEEAATRASGPLAELPLVDTQIRMENVKQESANLRDALAKVRTGASDDWHSVPGVA